MFKGPVSNDYCRSYNIENLHDDSSQIADHVGPELASMNSSYENNEIPSLEPESNFHCFGLLILAVFCLLR